MPANLVSRLIKRTNESLSGYSACLEPGEKILSNNKVTGCSINFPIAPTCMPTKVCGAHCYFAKGGSSWPASLKKQFRLYNSVRADPVATGEQLVQEIRGRRKMPSYIRWNGGGDLFAESVTMLHFVAAELPEIPFWVVTRIPEFAAEVQEADNIFLHFSLDATSGTRRQRFENSPKKTSNYFYSYQCARDELPTAEDLEGISVLFFDRYLPPEDLGLEDREMLCPLNERDDITGTCEECRRCFDQSAVQHRVSLEHRR